MRLEHWSFRQNVRGNKPLLKEEARLLTKEIRKRVVTRRAEHLDFRFILPLAQWMVEQGGYTITPQRSNPGNVMGRGDAGVFHRPNNIEIINGKRVRKPADFAAYSSMGVGTAAYFDNLQNLWPQSYAAILSGGAAEVFVHGLYPGPGRNYATLPQNAYLSRMRVRISYILPDYRAVLNDDLEEAGHRIPELQTLHANPRTDASLVDEIKFRIEGNRKLIDMLHSMVKELDEVEKRFQDGRALQPA